MAFVIRMYSGTGTAFFNIWCTAITSKQFMRRLAHSLFVWADSGGGGDLSWRRPQPG